MATVTVGGGPRFQPEDVSTPILQTGQAIQRGIESLGQIASQFVTDFNKLKTEKEKIAFTKIKALEKINSSAEQIKDPTTRDSYKEQYTKLIKNSKDLKNIGSITNDANSIMNVISRRSATNKSVADAPEAPVGPSIAPAQAPAGLSREEAPQQPLAPEAQAPAPQEAPAPPVGQVPPEGQAPQAAVPPVGQAPQGVPAPQNQNLARKVAFDQIDFSLAGTPGFGNELFDRDSDNIQRWQQSNISQIALEYQETTEVPDAEGFRQFVSQKAQETGQTAILNEVIINNIGKQFEGRGKIEGRALRRETSETAASARIKSARISSGKKASREDVIDIEKQKARFDKMTTEANKLIAGVQRSQSSEDVFDALLMDPADRKTLLGNRANTLTKAEEKTVIGNLGTQLLIRGQTTGEVIAGPEAEDAAKDILDGNADAATTVELINKLRPDQLQTLIAKFERLSPRAAEALKKIAEPKEEEQPAPSIAPAQREQLPAETQKPDLSQFLK